MENKNTFDTQISLYEANKNLMDKQKPLSPYKLNEKIQDVAKYILGFPREEYFMLLNNERHDYTIFVTKNNWSLAYFKETLAECLTNRGDVLSIAKDTSGGGMEIWLRINGENYVYYLFPYTQGVIEV